MDCDGGCSPGSTMAYSEMDEHISTQASSPARLDSARSSHQLTYQSDSQQNSPRDDMRRSMEAASGASTVVKPNSSRKRKDPTGAPINNTLYAGTKVKHLKKEDGEPLWRKDIQYDFLKFVFDDQNEVFTNSYEPEMPKQTFANLYIDTMARSSKTSKILRDKLLSEHEPAKNMAMLFSLIRVVFPEMRAQLRTYHAIPSLQAYQDPNSYKQLQDAPRLKSILKGASEDRPEPNTLDKIKQKELPRTNPVNVIFILAQYAPQITELHMPPGRDFYDLIMADNLSSYSRAKAFLWLLWFYLESDFTEEGAEENPFGPGVDYDVNVRNQGVPQFKVLTLDEQELENVDTPEEKEYGIAKMKERKRIIEADQAVYQAEHGPPKRGQKSKISLPGDEIGSAPSSLGRIRSKLELNWDNSSVLLGRIRPKYESDVNSTRSTPPHTTSTVRIQATSGSKARVSLKNQFIEDSSPAPQIEPAPRRSRPLTAHQLAVEKNRNQRVDHILSHGLRRIHHQAKKVRRQEGIFWRALQRTDKMFDPLEDSEDEENLNRDPLHFRERGFGGLVQLETEEDDFGEELSAYAAAFRRMGRRLNRWEGLKDPVNSITRNKKVSSVNPGGKNGCHEPDETEDEHFNRKKPRKTKNTGINIDEDEDLDEMEKEILGLQSEADEDLDDVDKALLGLGGDETEDGASDGAIYMD